MSKRTPSAKRITAADIDSAARIADDFAASLTSIAAAFAIGLTGESPSDPLAAALAFQRLSVDAAVLSRAIMARYWRAENAPRLPGHSSAYANADMIVVDGRIVKGKIGDIAAILAIEAKAREGQC